MNNQKIFNIISLLLPISIIITGCGYNPQTKNILFIGGVPYALPYGINVERRPLKKNDINLIYHRKAGMDCRPGDVSWTEHSVTKKISKNIQNTAITKAQRNKNTVAILHRGYLENKAGCAHPLSRQEYQYYLNRENQNAANQRASDLSTAIMTPKTVNVTGTVYHY